MCERHRWAIPSSLVGCVTCHWEPDIVGPDGEKSDALRELDAREDRRCKALGRLYADRSASLRRALVASAASRIARSAGKQWEER